MVFSRDVERTRLSFSVGPLEGVKVNLAFRKFFQVNDTKMT